MRTNPSQERLLQRRDELWLLAGWVTAAIGSAILLTVLMARWPIIGLALFGAGVALPQWALLRNHTRAAWRLLPATYISLLVGFFGSNAVVLILYLALLGLARPVATYVLGWVSDQITAIIGGSCLGLGQVIAIGWQRLRPWSRLLPWLLANGLGGAALAPTAFALMENAVAPGSYRLTPSGLLQGVAGAAVYGVATGAALVYLLRQFRPDDVRVPETAMTQGSVRQQL